MTPTERELLELLDEHGALPAGWIAQKLRPDSPSWKRHSNVGHGSTTGVGIRRWAGCLCGRVERAHGWVGRSQGKWSITSEGKAALRKAREADADFEDYAS